MTMTPAADMTIATTLPMVSTMIVAWSISPADASSYAGAIAIIIGALFIGWVNVIAAKAAARAAVKKELEPVAAKIDALEPVVKRIDLHVNSEKDRAVAELAQRDLRIELQDKIIEKLERAAELLAQAKATTDAANAIAAAAVAGATTPPIRAVAEQPVAGVPAAATSLNNIDDSTKQIEKNTKRTDQAVQDLKDKS